MLSENIKIIRKSKGLSQEELAIRLHVVRQTISKWEKGLSVPDSELLLALSEALETPVGELLGETVAEKPADDVRAIAEKLEVINLQLAGRKKCRRRLLCGLFILLLAVTAAVFIALLFLKSRYLDWNFADPETAVAAAALHAFEWVFFRAAPFLCVGAVVGIVLTGARR